MKEKKIKLRKGLSITHEQFPMSKEEEWFYQERKKSIERWNKYIYDVCQHPIIQEALEEEIIRLGLKFK